VGATSLGNYIFSGLQTRNHASVLIGCVASAGLALVLDQLIRLLELGLRKRRGRMTAAAAAGLAALALCAVGSFAVEKLRETGRPIVIGSKAFTEQYILAEVLAQRVETQTGLATRRLPSLGSTVAFDALVTGDLDLYADYTGTIFATLMKRKDQLPRQRILEEVTRYLSEEHGIRVVASLGFENTYALGMRRSHANALGIATISELAAHAPRLEIGADYEFFQRAEWAALETRYGLRFRRERSMDPALMYQAVAQEDVDVISAFSTDGRITAHDLLLLADDRAVIPPYDTLILASARLQAEEPHVLEALRPLENLIDATTMQRLNLAVDRDGQSPAEVARKLLAEALGP